MGLALAMMGPALGAGNLAALPERLPDLAINGDLTLSQHEYRLETGKYYRWRITSDGTDEFEIVAPELMRNSWVDKVVVDDTEVEVLGGVYGIRFGNDESTADVWFVPVRPGRYEFWVDGYKNRGLSGAFLVD